MSGNTEGREERPLTRVPEGLKDEMVEKAAKAPAGGWGKRELGIRDAESAVDAVADERAALTLSGTDANLFAAGYRAGLDAAQEGKAELPPFVKSVPLPDDHSGTSEPWALRILAEEIWFQERGDWPDEQDAEMFNDPERVKRFLTARTVARCWDSAEAALADLNGEPRVPLIDSIPDQSEARASVAALSKENGNDE